MSECWHYIRFGTISDGTITGMHCTVFSHIWLNLFVVRMVFVVLPCDGTCAVHSADCTHIDLTCHFPIQVSAVFDSASSPARHAADRDPRGERQVTNYHSKGPSRHPILRWFKVRFVRTGTKMACRYIIEVPSLLWQKKSIFNEIAAGAHTKSPQNKQFDWSSFIGKQSDWSDWSLLLEVRHT